MAVSIFLIIKKVYNEREIDEKIGIGGEILFPNVACVQQMYFCNIHERKSWIMCGKRKHVKTEWYFDFQIKSSAQA